LTFEDAAAPPMRRRFLRYPKGLQAGKVMVCFNLKFIITLRWEAPNLKHIEIF
jgi:hypothetical protein